MHISAYTMLAPPPHGVAVGHLAAKFPWAALYPAQAHFGVSSMCCATQVGSGTYHPLSSSTVPR